LVGLPGQRCPGADGGCRDRSGIAGTRSSQPLPENVEELGGGSPVQAEYAGAVDVRVQHDLTVDLADSEIAEPLLPSIWQVVGIVRSSVLMRFPIFELGSKHAMGSDHV
jgi:hypothetical protein